MEASRVCCIGGLGFLFCDLFGVFTSVLFLFYNLRAGNVCMRDILVLGDGMDLGVSI
jgi:hypothetical protein